MVPKILIRRRIPQVDFVSVLRVFMAALLYSSTLWWNSVVWTQLRRLAKEEGSTIRIGKVCLSDIEGFWHLAVYKDSRGGEAGEQGYTAAELPIDRAGRGRRACGQRGVSIIPPVNTKSLSVLPFVLPTVSW